MKEKKFIIEETEIKRVYKNLAKVRGTDDLPTRQEVEEMITRMKKRWEIAPNTQ